MMQGFPRGTRIGAMEAPFEWILTHTTRFQGIVQVTVGDGKGYVLIKRGSAVGCFFGMGEKILRGTTAIHYLRSLPLVHHSIIRYINSEFEEAQRLLDPQEIVSSLPVQPAPPATEPGNLHIESLILPIEIPESQAEEPDEDPDIAYPLDLDTDLVAQLLLGRIVRLPHVQAVTIFGGGTSVLAMGDINLESVVIHSEDILQAIDEIKSVMNTGSFVHFTLQVPSGNVIIAPYFDEYLCILTGPQINLGKIRKILKQIPQIPAHRSGEG
ncbi:MAG TPA: hypothetical protein VMW63_06555 [Methanoregulaceae archaeon]|nr:hypothetical protein [Methanoregulaceae archaeon]